MNFDSSGQHDLMRGGHALISKRFQEEFGRLPDIGEALLDLLDPLNH